MAIEDLVGTPRRIVKFASIFMAVLMTGGVMALFMYGRPWLAVASAIVGAWAVLVFTEVIKAELAEILSSSDTSAEPDGPRDSSSND